MPWITTGSMRNVNIKDVEHTVKKMDKNLYSFLSEVFIQPTELLYNYRQDDKDMIIKAKEDVMHFDHVYKKYHEHIQKYFYYRLGMNKQASEDLTQETFYRALRYIEKFQFLLKFQQSPSFPKAVQLC